MITRALADDAANTNAVWHQGALSAIRVVGDTNAIHRACYQQGQPSLEIAGWILSGAPLGTPFNGTAQALGPEKARELYYLVTGKLFSDVPPKRGRIPRPAFGRDRRDGGSEAEEWVWDGERGSSDVGARLQGLSLVNSAMQWHVENAAGLAYGEWTLEYENLHANPQEARCQVLLPPGGTVSRLTLWVNGQPQEAAFDARAKVTAAYTQVVNVERRDPVLVTMVGPDRVLVQCFPVPAKGGHMKIRLGITAPVDGTTRNRLWMPCFLERNFNATATLRHHLELTADGAFDQAKAEGKTWSAGREVPTADLAHASFSFDPKALAGVVWAEDKLGGPKEGKYLVRESVPAALPSWQEVVCVIDTSVGLKPYRAALTSALLALPPEVKLTALLADDASFRKADRQGLAAGLDAVGFTGGRDNTPAMLEAIKLVQASPNACVLWLHGPQPVVFGAQRTAWNLHAPVTVYPVELETGPNRVLEQLYRVAIVRPVPRITGAADVTSVVHDLVTAPVASRHRFSHRTTPPAGDAVAVSDQLVRHWVYGEVLAHFRGLNDVPDAQAALASRYQLVTPYSGAVVLETKEQYQKAGLTPAEASMSPALPGSTPEPSTSLLLLLGLGLLLLQRRRHSAWV